MTPKPRRTHQSKNGGLCQHEIEPGRSVVNNWDKALFEPWSDRKARRAAERAAGGVG